MIRKKDIDIYTMKLGYIMGGERTIFLELFGDRSLVPVGDSSQHVGRKLRTVGWAGKKEKTYIFLKKCVVPDF
jgi:hypothetical protein